MFYRQERKAAAALSNLMAQTRDTMVCFEFPDPVDPSEPQHIINEKLRGAIIVEASQTFARYFRLDDRQSLIGTRLTDLFHGDIPTWFTNYGQEVEDGNFQNIERQVEIPVGDKLRPMRIYMQNIFEDERLISQWVTLRDISEEVKQARVIEENERLKLLALEAVGLHTYSLDFQGPDDRELHGRVTVGDSPVADWWQHIHPDDAATLEKTFANFYNGGVEQMHTMFRTIRSNGEPSWMESWTIASHRDEHGKPQGVAGVIMDRSESKALEQRMAEGHRLESLGVMAGGIAHDFNNLLMSITGTLDLLNNNHPELSGEIKVIDDAATQAAQLCDHLLTYAGRGSGELIALDLSQVVHDMSDLITVALHKDASLKVDCGDRYWVRGDASQLTQVIMNLTQNASDALDGKPGNVTVRVQQVTYQKDWYYSFHLGGDLLPGEYVAIEIEDDGIGIADIEFDRLFDPFYTTKFTGRGLGLAVVMGIVRGHSGGIKIESEQGKGTRVTVVLPQHHAVNLTTQSIAKAVDNQLQGCVLVVDDEPAVRMIAERLLNNIGFEVVTANDGFSALNLVDQSPDKFDIILIDVTMPRMDGIETASQMLDKHPDSRIVICSGYSNVVMSAKLSREVDFLQKPYRIAQLREKLGKLLAP